MIEICGLQLNTPDDDSETLAMSSVTVAIVAGHFAITLGSKNPAFATRGTKTQEGRARYMSACAS